MRVISLSSGAGQTGDVHLIFVQRIKKGDLFLVGRQVDLLDVPGNQQITDSAVGIGSPVVAAAFNVGIVDLVGQISGGLVLLSGEEGEIIVEKLKSSLL